MTDTPETKPLDSTRDKPFEPVIIGFTCNWCSYRAADMAGTARMKYAPNVRLIRLMCSGRMDPTFVFKALAGGADGVLVSGCHPGDCHYINQNYKAMRRFQLMKRVLTQLGIEPGRLKLFWASAAEGAMFTREINTFVEQVRALGPLNWNSDHEPSTMDNESVPMVDGRSSVEEVAA
jgi:F420-non-reducing hydrogenase iron-sulfur subunit